MANRVDDTQSAALAMDNGSEREASSLKIAVRVSRYRLPWVMITLLQAGAVTDLKTK